MKISVVIPCRNEKRHIHELLDSVLAQQLDRGQQMEILVADGMSSDGTREALREMARSRPDIRIVDNPGCIVSTGLNAAIEASAGEVVIRMDAHTTYAPDYIRQCITVLESTNADSVGGPWIARGSGVMGRAIAAAFQSSFCAGGGKAHDPNYEGEVDTVYLGCWRREVFQRAGLFDAALVRNQDDEFNFRLRKRGGRIWQSPRIRSFYTPRRSLAALFRQYLQYGFWKVAVIRKHRALASWRHAVPALFAGSIAAAAALGVAAEAAHSHWAAVIGASLSVELAVYFLACAAAALALRRSLPLLSLAALPLVIATYHLAYGLGFLWGVLTPSPRNGDAEAPQLFTALTR